MRDEKLKRMLFIALLMGLAAVLTMLVAVPIGIIPGAYVHPGDAIIFVAAYLFGPAAGAIVGGIGGAIADAAVGAYIYIIPTLIVKAVMGTLAGLALKKTDIRKSWLSGCLRMLLTTVSMILGYGLYEGFAFGWGLAAASVPFNVLQAVVSSVLATFTLVFIMRIPWLASLRDDEGGIGR
ncbi:MAG: ECF transporter S component [Christensenellales bacterium]